MVLETPFYHSLTCDSIMLCMSIYPDQGGNDPGANDRGK